MQFNSYFFIFIFLPLFIIVYFLANRIRLFWGKMVIIIASVIFYSYYEVEMLYYLAISILINLFFVFLFKRLLCSKWILVLPIAINVGMLLYYKYYSFAVSNFHRLVGVESEVRSVILPLGISFYTFQQIAYVVSVARGELTEYSILDYLCFVLFFPKLLMGPLMEPIDFFRQLNDGERKHVIIRKLSCGLKMFSYGLIKKVMLADTFAKGSSYIRNNIDVSSSFECVLLILFYTFYIYFDFSGYTDMATGVSYMFNFDLPINFDSPYKALSIRDFWKRWHISLTGFLTKYIYIPIGGSKNGIIRTLINTMIVFFISGLWHGANWTFILWGILHGLFSCMERLFAGVLDRIHNTIRWLVTFVVVSILWLLFSSSSVSEWWSILKRLFEFNSLTISTELLGIFDLPEFSYLFSLLHFNVAGAGMIIMIMISFFVCLVPKNNYIQRDKLTVPSCVFSALMMVWGILFLGVESTFIYSGF